MSVFKPFPDLRNALDPFKDVLHPTLPVTFSWRVDEWGRSYSIRVQPEDWLNCYPGPVVFHLPNAKAIEEFPSRGQTVNVGLFARLWRKIPEAFDSPPWADFEFPGFDVRRHL